MFKYKIYILKLMCLLLLKKFNYLEIWNEIEFEYVWGIEYINFLKKLMYIVML